MVVIAVIKTYSMLASLVHLNMMTNIASQQTATSKVAALKGAIGIIK